MLAKALGSSIPIVHSEDTMTTLVYWGLEEIPIPLCSVYHISQCSGPLGIEWPMHVHTLEVCNTDD